MRIVLSRLELLTFLSLPCLPCLPLHSCQTTLVTVNASLMNVEEPPVFPDLNVSLVAYVSEATEFTPAVGQV